MDLRRITNIGIKFVDISSRALREEIIVVDDVISIVKKIREFSRRFVSNIQRINVRDYHALQHIINNEIDEFLSLSEDNGELSDRLLTNLEIALRKAVSGLKILIEKFSQFDTDRFPEEAPKNSELGSYAFAELRNDVPFEPNTDFEDRLQHSLRSYFDKATQIDTTESDAIKSFLDRKIYATIFRELEPNQIVYRGMGVGADKIEKLIGIVPNKNGTRNTRFIISPKQGDVSAWTLDRTIADDFSHGKNKFSIVFRARAVDNPKKFVKCPDGLYRIKLFRTHELEREVLAIGDITAEGITWEINDDIH